MNSSLVAPRYLAKTLTVLSFFLIISGGFTGILVSSSLQQQPQILEQEPVPPGGGSEPGVIQCSANCLSAPWGGYKFCYNECSKTGSSRPVGCATGGFVIGDEQRDTECDDFGQPSGNVVICNDSCTYNPETDGDKHFCYNECAPNSPGFSQDVYCTASGWHTENKTINPSMCPTSGGGGQSGGGQGGGQSGGGQTGTPAQGFFLSGSVSPKNGTDGAAGCDVTIRFVSTGCDGDIVLTQPNGTEVGPNGWGNIGGDFVYFPDWTGSPYNPGQTLTWSGKIINSHATGQVCVGQTSSLTLTLPQNCSESGSASGGGGQSGGGQGGGQSGGGGQGQTCSADGRSYCSTEDECGAIGGAWVGGAASLGCPEVCCTPPQPEGGGGSGGNSSNQSASCPDGCFHQASGTCIPEAQYQCLSDVLFFCPSKGGVSLSTNKSCTTFAYLDACSTIAGGMCVPNSGCQEVIFGTDGYCTDGVCCKRLISQPTSSAPYTEPYEDALVTLEQYDLLEKSTNEAILQIIESSASESTEDDIPATVISTYYTYTCSTPNLQMKYCTPQADGSCTIPQCISSPVSM